MDDSSAHVDLIASVHTLFCFWSCGQSGVAFSVCMPASILVEKHTVPDLGTLKLWFMKLLLELPSWSPSTGGRVSSSSPILCNSTISCWCISCCCLSYLTISSLNVPTIRFFLSLLNSFSLPSNFMLTTMSNKTSFFTFQLCSTFPLDSFEQLSHEQISSPMRFYLIGLFLNEHFDDNLDNILQTMLGWSWCQFMINTKGLMPLF